MPILLTFFRHQATAFKTTIQLSLYIFTQKFPAVLAGSEYRGICFTYREILSVATAAIAASVTAEYQKSYYKNPKTLVVFEQMT